MPLNDKTLTAVTAVCLAFGVAIAGFVLRGNEVERVMADGPAPVNYLAPLKPQKPSEIGLAALPSPQVDHKPATPSQFNLAQPATEIDKTPTKLPTKSRFVGLPAPFHPDNLPPVSRPEDANFGKMLVFASVEPILRQDRSYSGLGMILGDIQTIGPELKVLAKANELDKSTPIAVIGGTVRFASLPSMAPSTSISDISPTGASDLPVDACNITLKASPKPAARVSLEVNARCHPNKVVTVEHANLRFRETLDANGELTVSIPAFSEFSLFSISLDGGINAMVGVYVAGLSSVDRVGISWSGRDDTFLHAFEGTNLQNGHRWRLSPGSYRRSQMDGGGYLTLLGDPQLPNAELTQVYSRRKFQSNTFKFVSLTLETLRGDTDCGGTLSVMTARHTPEIGYSSTQNKIRLQDCNSTTGSLVLKNLVKDLRVAQN